MLIRWAAFSVRKPDWHSSGDGITEKVAWHNREKVRCEGLNAVVCSRARGLQEALSAATSALETSSRNARVAAPQKRCDRLRARSAGRGPGRSARRRQRSAGARLQRPGSGPAGDANRPRRGLAGRGTPRSRAPGGRGIGADVASPQPGCAPWWACPSIPRQCRGRRRATVVGWRDRLESDPSRGRRRRRWATEPQQIPSAGTWI
jgi:hypothetical protein